MENIYVSHHLQGAGHVVSAAVHAAQLVWNTCEGRGLRG